MDRMGGAVAAVMQIRELVRMAIRRPMIAAAVECALRLAHPQRTEP